MRPFTVARSGVEYWRCGQHFNCPHLARW